MLQLKPGQYYGESRWERSIQGLRLTLSSYQTNHTQPWHRHTHPTFFLLLSGDHGDATRHGTHRQLPYTFVFHPTTTDHASELGPTQVRGLNIEYEPEWLSRYDLDDREIREYKVFQSVQARLSALRFLTNAFQSGTRIEDELETQAFELLAASTACKVSTPDAPHWLQQAEDYLNTRYRDSISLRDVAQEIHVHPVYLARVFRRRHQCNVSHYLRMLRLTEAARLVMQGSPLAQASYAAGFADQAHFSRSCSSMMGFSPKNFRSARFVFQQ